MRYRRTSGSSKGRSAVSVFQPLDAMQVTRNKWTETPEARIRHRTNLGALFAIRCSVL